MTAWCVVYEFGSGSIDENRYYTRGDAMSEYRAVLADPPPDVVAIGSRDSANAKSGPRSSSPTMWFNARAYEFRKLSHEAAEPPDRGRAPATRSRIPLPRSSPITAARHLSFADSEGWESATQRGWQPVLGGQSRRP